MPPLQVRLLLREILKRRCRIIKRSGKSCGGGGPALMPMTQGSENCSRFSRTLHPRLSGLSVPVEVPPDALRQGCRYASWRRLVPDLVRPLRCHGVPLPEPRVV
jgi:hypothetical protein